MTTSRKRPPKPDIKGGRFREIPLRPKQTRSSWCFVSDVNDVISRRRDMREKFNSISHYEISEFDYIAELKKHGFLAVALKY